MLKHRWPKAIVHVDGDAFFASVEQAVNPSLKGKPVVTGQERNIVAAASYEAKAFGVTRGVTLWDAKKLCPGLIVLPTDYETVSLFSKRMFDIARRYSPTIEEYGIDESFIDITGTRRVHHTSYENIARRLQAEIHQELGITVSVGLSVSKVLAKIGSKMHKPAGFTAINAQQIESFIQKIPVETIWNIGPNTAALLRNHGITSALAFAKTPKEQVEKILSRPGMAVWEEINGQSVWPVSSGDKISYKSISKTKTFTPPSTDREYVFAQLMKNLENACMKARRYHQAAQKISIFLKRQDHKYFGIEASLNRASCYPNELASLVREMFNQIFVGATAYRATGVTLINLVADTPSQPTLFEKPITLLKVKKLYGAVDILRDKYGKHAVHQAVSLPAQARQHLSRRGHEAARKKILLPGETKRQRLPLPLLQIRVN